MKRFDRENVLRSIGLLDLQFVHLRTGSNISASQLTFAVLHVLLQVEPDECRRFFSIFSIENKVAIKR